MGRPTLKHRDILRGSIRCFFKIAGALSFFLFSIKEESTRLATSTSFSKRPNAKEPSRVEILLQLVQALLLKTPTGSASPASSSSTLAHVHQATSAPVVQEGYQSLRDGPVVAPLPPIRPGGRYSRKCTQLSRLSSTRNNSESPVPFGRS